MTESEGISPEHVELAHQMLDLARLGHVQRLLAYVDAGVPVDLTDAASIRAETEVAGAPTGGMDQTVSMLVESGAALLIDFEDHTTRPVPLALDEAGLALLVTDTRVSHALIDGGYASRRQDCEAAAERLGVPSLRHADLAAVEALDDERVRRRARHVVTEIGRVRDAVAAIETGDWQELGRQFLASHVSMREDFEISCPELDTVVQTAVEAGAVGARMTGGGFGGSAISLVPVERLAAVVDLLGRATAKIHCAADEDSDQSLVDFQTEEAIVAVVEGRRKEFVADLTDFAVESYFEHEAHRTVVSQRALQVHTDPLLGYSTVDGVGYVISEISPYEVDLDWSGITEPDDIAAVVDLLGRATAKVHCASDEDSDQSLVEFQTEHVIARCLEGRRRQFTEDIVEFGITYAQRAREDHRLFVEAFRAGKVGVTSA